MLKRIICTLLLMAGILLADSHITAATGNWTVAGTWGLGEAGASAIQTTRSAEQYTTAAYVSSSAWTCTNLDVLDAIVMYLRRLNSTGTITIGLSDDNGATYAREITVNATDLSVSNAWVIFKFASGLTCDGGADYKVAIKASDANNASFYRDGTAGNWIRVPRTTTTGAPAAGDIIYVADELTGAGTKNEIAITFNETVVADCSTAIDYGKIDVGFGGVLSYGTTAATRYCLKTSGVLEIWSGGTLNIGTVATPMPSDSKAWLLFDCTSNVEFGLEVEDGGTFVSQGAAMTAVSAYLAEDAPVNDTGLVSSLATGWKDNDQIVAASTTRTVAESEIGALNGDAVGTAITVDGFGGAGGGVAYAHSGTVPTRAELINLTRTNVIQGVSALLQTYIWIGNTATADVDYTEFLWHGSGVANKRGIDIQTTTGSCNIAYSSIHNFQVGGSIGIYISGVATSNVTVDHNVIWYIDAFSIWIMPTSGTWAVTNNTIIRNLSSYLVVLEDSEGSFNGNTMISGTNAGLFATSVTTFPISAWTGNTFHSNGSFAIYLSGGLITGSILNSTAWRNNQAGIYFAARTYGLEIDGFTSFGNLEATFIFPVSQSGVKLSGVVSSGDSTFATLYGIEVANGVHATGIVLNNSTFGVAAGIKVAHTNDVIIGGGSVLDLVGSFVTFASGTPISGLASTTPTSQLSIQAWGQTTGDHRAYYPHGIARSDTVIYRIAPSSERLTPSSATIKLASGPFYYTVDNGGSVKVQVYVRKSQAADPVGADYNGAQPRLILKANPGLGVNSDTVLDTMTVALGTWEVLEGTTPAAIDDGAFEVIVDSDGTAGWVNVDRSKYWFKGKPTPQGKGSSTLRYAAAH